MFNPLQGGSEKQHVCLNLLKDKVAHWVSEVIEDEIILQQDGATSHTAKIVQKQCKDNFKAF